MQTFYLKRHDLMPPIQATLKDASGVAVNLESCTVAFHMWQDDAPATVYAAATVVTAASGVVRYDWILGDTDVEGTYNCEWEVTYPDQKTATWPNFEDDSVVITPDATELVQEAAA